MHELLARQSYTSHPYICGRRPRIARQLSLPGVVTSSRYAGVHSSCLVSSLSRQANGTSCRVSVGLKQPAGTCVTCLKSSCKQAAEHDG